MSIWQPDPTERETFSAIADVLIPAARGMPSASEVDVAGAPLTHVLSLRPELAEAVRRGLAAAAAHPASEAAEILNRDDPQALGAIGLLACAAYYRDEAVRKRLGYPGQTHDPVREGEENDFLEDGLLDAVIARGLPSARATPASRTRDPNDT